MKIAELTYPEVRGLLDQGAVALWPIGATEAHGPHLPLNTDVLIAEETCLRAVPIVRDRLGLEALILPPLAYSVTNFAEPFSGTVNLPRETVIPYVRDVILSVAAQGFRAVVLVNGHVEPAHRFTIRDAVKAAEHAPCPVALADPADRRWVDRLTPEFQTGSCHAGQYETSLIMAAKPKLVREGLRAGLAEHQIPLVEAIRGGAKSFIEAGAPNAYCGAPASASREEGDASYVVLAEIVVEILQGLLNEESP